ncbi:carboxypeptidase regulatory-like domain-containing protein [Paenibacillus sp. IITD108]|uniref:carboxypeptidase regulatory-like domain-containing protein n=1 Tax=Paenibacillus sp. IITD108 TaxID=3116649 RepID=UPI002F409642
MRRKVTIKVKHLVMTTLLLMIGIPFFINIVQPQAETLLAKWRPELIDWESRSTKIVDKIDKASGSKKWELIREHIIEGSSDDIRQAPIFVGSGMSQRQGPSEAAIQIGNEDTIKFLEQYISSGPADGYLSRAARQLAYKYSKIGEQEKAITALEAAEQRLLESSENGIRQSFGLYELTLQRAKMLADLGDLKRSDHLLNELKNKWETTDIRENEQIAFLQMKNSLHSGKLEEALNIVEEQVGTKEKSQLWETSNYAINIHGTLLMLRDLMDRMLEKGGKPAVISGKVTRSDGTPVAGVGVFLRLKENLYHSLMTDEPYQTISDANGNYSFHGVLAGSYQLYLGLDYEQVDGYTWSTGRDVWFDVDDSDQTGQIFEQPLVLVPLIELNEPVNKQIITDSMIRFSWEPVAGAAYYNLIGHVPVTNGANGATIETHIKTNFKQMTADELYDTLALISYGERGDWSSIVPEPLLGFANPDALFFWEVQAFDEHGNFLSSSSGYRLDEDTIGNLPFFYLKTRTLTDADQLLLAGKPDDALAAYRIAFENNEQDLYSLRMITKMLQAKYSVLGEAEIKQEELKYLQQQYKLAPTERVVSRLIDYYYEEADWTAYHKAINEYLLLSDYGKLGDYEQSRYATALMKQGKLKEAQQQFEIAMELDKTHRFVGNYLAVLLYNDTSFELALQAAEQYRDRTSWSGSFNWSQLIERLQAEAARQSAESSKEAYLKELQKGLELYFYDGDLKEWLKQIKPYPALRSFIESLQKVS